MKLLFQILLSLCVIFAIGQETPKPTYKSYFGFSLEQTMYGGMIHYGIARVHADGKEEYRYCSRHVWLLQVAGHIASEANPDTVNLFLKYDIDPKIVLDLWKLRYSEFPYKSQNQTMGWAQKPYGPSDAQLAFLKKYGFKTITSFVYGYNAFRLLKDMMDPDWVSNYMNLGLDNGTE
ncbi:MAG: hypothetical protein Kow0068_09730 [Marinilabiliales bacterium]